MLNRYTYWPTVNVTEWVSGPCQSCPQLHEVDAQRVLNRGFYSSFSESIVVCQETGGVCGGGVVGGGRVGGGGYFLEFHGKKCFKRQLESHSQIVHHSRTVRSHDGEQQTEHA